MFYNYILVSLKNGEFYTGFTDNLVRRLKEHNQGLNFSTKRYLPWKLIYYEACLDKDDALRREKYLKTTQGIRMVKRRLKEYIYKSRKNLTN
jgi:putative endonuclease